jgi:predicted MPP superfamily phosphohydrolase
MVIFVIWRVAFANKLSRKQKAWVIPSTLLIIAYGLSSLPLGMGTLNSRSKELYLFIIGGYLTLIMLLYLFLGLIVVMVISVMWRMVTDTDSDDSAAQRVRFMRKATIAILAIALGITGWGYLQARTPKLTHVDYYHKQVPSEFNGFTIALITDLHIGSGHGGEWLTQVVSQVNSAQPDLIVIAGDLVDGTPESTGDDLEPLTKLSAPYGVYITTGNHEFYSGAAAWAQFWAEHAIPVLDNESVVIRRAGASFDLVGINDRTGSTPYQPDLSAAINSLSTWGVLPADTTRLRILAAHQPVQAIADDGLAERLGVDLQLSGHTHGGQVWPLHLLVKLQQPVVSGVHEISGITVITSRGAGTWGPPVRVLADPEIVLVTLHNES